jgi:SSS family solute:Na+ symporter
MTPLLVAGLYLAAVAWIGFRSRAGSEAKQFLLAGGGASQLLLVGSLLATIFGSYGVVGVAGEAYKGGLIAGWYHWVGTIGLFLLALWALPRVSLQGVYSLPELFGVRFGALARGLMAALIILSWVFIIAAQFTAAGGLIEALLPGSRTGAVLLTSLLTVAYTIRGGQLSVLRTDLLQAVLIAIGLVLLLGAATSRGALSDLPASYWQFPFSEKLTFGAWLLLLLQFGVPFLIGPDIYSRLLCGRSEGEARRAVLVAAPLMIPCVLLITLTGMAARGILGPDATGNVILAVALQTLPGVLVGVVAAALLAAFMSSADTCLMTVGTLAARDIPALWGGEPRGTRTAQVTMAVAGLGAIVLALQGKAIMDLLRHAYSYYSPAVLAPFVLMLVAPKHRFHWFSAPLAMGLALACKWTLPSNLQLVAFTAPLIPLGADLLTNRAPRSS